MSSNKYRKMIDFVTKKTPGGLVGCSLHLDYVPCGYFIFTFMDRPYPAGPAHTLRADVTSLDRLIAHWEGFVANHAKAA